MRWKMHICSNSDCTWEATDGHIKHNIEEVTVTNVGLACPLCGCFLGVYYHDSRNHVGIFSEEERVSLAMGVQPCQIEEATKAFPGSRYRSDGALLYKGRSGKKAAMRQRGYTEY